MLAFKAMVLILAMLTFLLLRHNLEQDTIVANADGPLDRLSNNTDVAKEGKWLAGNDDASDT